MSQIWIYSLVSVFIVSLISFVGVFAIALNPEKLKKILLYLVSFSAGALLGDVFIHILPEMSEQGFSSESGMYIIAGIVLFFILEQFVWWHHSHSDHKEEIHSMVYLTQVGDTLHNFIDGMIIAAAYFVSIPVGIATTIAVIFHEIPQEIGNFAILVHGGWKAKKALLMNFFSALSAVLGAVLVMVFLRAEEVVPTWLIALAASSFIYISMSDIMPELQKEKDGKKSSLLVLCFILGILVMSGLLLLE
jgi:zinc and cadmium transporter